jgi:enolase
MIALDGTANKASSAPTPFSASRSPQPRPLRKSSGLPLYRYVGGANAHGAAGADDEHHQWRRACRQPDRLQEFMIMPVGAIRCADAVRMGAEVFHTLKKELAAGGPQHQCRRRGRLCAQSQERAEALDFIMKSIEKAGYKAWRGHVPGARLRRDRILQGTASTTMEGEGRSLEPEHGRIPRRAAGQVSDHLDRGRHGGR